MFLYALPAGHAGTHGLRVGSARAPVGPRHSELEGEVEGRDGGKGRKRSVGMRMGEGGEGGYGGKGRKRAREG